MFRSFFLSREWSLWAWGGMAIIIGGTWYQVQVDVQINEWFGLNSTTACRRRWANPAA